VPDENGLVTEFDALLAEEDQVFDRVTAASLDRENYQARDFFEDLLNGTDGINDATTTGSNIKGRFTTLMTLAREIALALPALDAAPATPSSLKALLTSLKSDTRLHGHLANLI